jgi:hypothetical protein
MFTTQRQSCSRRNSLLRQARRTPTSTVLSEEKFRLKLERAFFVADRFRRPFSLAIFRLPAATLRPATDRQVMGLLAQRAGLSADVGQLGASGLGVLLRETETAAAHQFCSRIAADLAEIGADVAWRVICFPNAGTPTNEAAGARASYQQLGACR